MTSRICRSCARPRARFHRLAHRRRRRRRNGPSSRTRPPPAAAQSRRSSKDKTDYRFPLAIYKPFSGKDVEVSVRFKPVAGTVDQAGGIAVRLQTPDDYYVVRANALEDNVRFYRVVKGKREQLASANTKVATNSGTRWRSRPKATASPSLLTARSCSPREDKTFAGCRQGRAVDQGRQRHLFRHDLDHAARLIRARSELWPTR